MAEPFGSPPPFAGPPAAVPTGRPSAGKGAIWTGAVLLTIGTVVGIITLVKVVAPTFEVMNSPTMTIPGSHRFTLEPGTYGIYERTGAATGVPNLGQPDNVSFGAADVVITSPSGTRIPATTMRTAGSIQNGSSVFTGVATFPVATAGSYEVRIDDAKPGQAMVGASMEQLGRTIIGWVLGMFAAGAVFVVGFIVLIVGLVRRGRATRNARAWAGAPGVPPPGYGFPPSAGYGPAGASTPGAPPSGVRAPGWVPPPGGSPPPGPAAPPATPAPAPPKDPWNPGI